MTQVRHWTNERTRFPKNFKIKTKTRPPKERKTVNRAEADVSGWGRAIERITGGMQYGKRIHKTATKPKNTVDI